VRVASPEGFELPVQVRQGIAAIASAGGTLESTDDPIAAVTGADAVYTDVWTSMGNEDQASRRRSIFRPFQVNAALMAHAAPDAVFMHCLPAHRGDEVTDEVIDSAASAVFDQAENRLHVQKALMAMMAN
jgi:ornithine carbamoyltransferase